MTSIASWSRRGFASAMACVAVGVMAARRDEALALPGSHGIDVKRFGAVGDGTHNDSGAFAAALEAETAIFVPAGIYRLDRLLVPAGRTILTSGLTTVFRQRPGLPAAMRPYRVVGSNVRIGDFAVEGNIAADDGEWHHGLSIEADSETGSLSNITIGNVRGRNLCGDVVCIGGRRDSPVRNVRVGHVSGDNVLRNVVSIVGGSHLSIDRVTGTRVGFTHLDIEPEDYSGPVVDCTVGSVVGSFVQVAGTTANSYVDRTRIGVLDLAPPAARSLPSYPPGLDRDDALTVRNIRSLEIGHLAAKGFGGQAIRQIWDPGALTDQQLHIFAAELSDCARDPRSGNAFIMGSRRATRLRIDSLMISGVRRGVDAVRDCNSVRIGHVRGLPRGSRLIAESGGFDERLLYVLAGGALLHGIRRFARPW